MEYTTVPVRDILKATVQFLPIVEHKYKMPLFNDSLVS